MAVKQIKISVNELTIGMFISGLDRPWTQTPFPLQGFYLRDQSEITELKMYCNTVVIDIERGRAPIVAPTQALLTPEPVKRDSDAKFTGGLASIKVAAQAYPDTVPFVQEMSVAQQLYQRVNTAIADVMRLIDTNQWQQVSYQHAQQIASEMVDSILRNPDAFSWLARIQAKDEHTYSHAIRSAVWAILFGRHLGVAKRDLDILALGVLFKDVGKIKLPAQLLSKSPLSEKERSMYERFVDMGCHILRQIPDMEPRVVSVVKHHCERLNGSGFPQGLAGDKIPLLGKIASIVTFYDQITNPRGVTDPIAPSRAVARLYELRQSQFQEELVVEFIRAIGLYPTGTVVELTSGEIAVVVEQNFARRLKPKVVVVLDAHKQPARDWPLIDLADDEKRKQALVNSGHKNPKDLIRLDIARDLEASQHHIDVIAIRDHYVASNSKKSVKGFLSRWLVRA